MALLRVINWHIIYIYTTKDHAPWYVSRRSCLACRCRSFQTFTKLAIAGSSYSKCGQQIKTFSSIWRMLPFWSSYLLMSAVIFVVCAYTENHWAHYHKASGDRIVGARNCVRPSSLRGSVSSFSHAFSVMRDVGLGMGSKRSTNSIHKQLVIFGVCLGL